MGLWFDNNNEDEKFINYLPTGRSYKQASVEGTSFNNIVLWIASSFKWLVDSYNEVFKGVYICESNYLLESYKKQFSIPNDVFPLSDDNWKDVYVIKYLMNGNTDWHFRAIASVYDVDIEIKKWDDIKYSEEFSLDFPVIFGGEEYHKNALIIYLKTAVKSGFNLDFPVNFGDDDRVNKLKKIFEIIKSKQVKIIYIEDENTEMERIKLCSAF